MNLFLISYASVAIVAPALWIGVCLWLRRHSRTRIPGFTTAQIIAFPIAMVASNRRCGRPHWETNGQRLRAANDDACRKADQYVVERRRSLSQSTDEVTVAQTCECFKAQIPGGSQFWISRHWRTLC